MPRAAPCTLPTYNDAAPGLCSTDYDCRDHLFGACGFLPYGGGPVAGCECFYGCVFDSDCTAGQVCLCDDPVGVCVDASCKTDADCGPGSLCTLSAPLGTCSPGQSFACQTAQDTCGGPADCNGSQACSYVASHHQCEPVCVFGRPFLVRGTARSSEVVARDDWQAENVTPRLSDLSVVERAALGVAWERMARMEHASIAAFARFALQLLSLGAPGKLVEQTCEAMRDETEHARMCFALASAYHGRAVGPAALSMCDAMADIDLESILATTILEGCIGETVAAIEAAEAFEHCVDPTVSRVLSEIAEDERRHAGLAWQFVSWAISKNARLRAVAAATFESAIAPRPTVQSISNEDGRLLQFGVIPDSARAAIRASVLREVVAPCARALLPHSSLEREASLA